MYAVIETGGKQYKVSVGDKFDVEKLEAAEGDTATFDQVLAAGEGSSITVGAPIRAGASVSAKVIKQHKADKATTFKSGWLACKLRVAAIPLTVGMLTSITTTSGCRRQAISTASKPVSAWPTTSSSRPTRRPS